MPEFWGCLSQRRKRLKTPLPVISTTFLFFTSSQNVDIFYILVLPEKTRRL